MSMNQKEKVFVLGPDLGNSWTDVYSSEGKLTSFPSLLAPGRVTRYQYNFDSGEAHEKLLDNLTLQDEEGMFFVGHAAYDHGDPAKIKLSHDQGQSLRIKQKMLEVAMAITLPQECKVKLLLGHPYSESHLAPDMATMAKSIKPFTLNGQEFNIEVMDVETIAQAVAAFLGVVTDLDGKPIQKYADLLSTPVLVDDIGGGTRDICFIEKNPRTGRLEVKDQYSGSDRYGVWYALQIIREEIYARYQVQKPVVELEYELFKDGTKVILEGKPIDIASIKEAAFAQASSDGMTFITNLIPPTVRNKIGRIFITGGGSLRFKDQLLPLYKSVFGERFEFIPKYSIAKGQHSKAVRLWGER